MKKYLMISMAAIMSFCFLGATAQDEMQYLFSGTDKDVSVSGFAAVINEFSGFDKEFGFSLGGGAALLIDQKFFLGGYGLGLTTQHLNSYVRYNREAATNKYSGDLYTRFGHGGFWLGYIHNAHNAIHWGVNAKLGWGAVSLTDKIERGDTYKWDNYDYDNVFVITPQVDLNMNLLSWMRLNVGLGYRVVTGLNKTYEYLPDNDPLQKPVEKEYFDKNAFNSVTGTVTLAFGWFNK